MEFHLSVWSLLWHNKSDMKQILHHTDGVYDIWEMGSDTHSGLGCRSILKDGSVSAATY